MGIKFDPITKTWEAFYSKRHPKTGKSINTRRIKLSSESTAKKVERELILQIEEKIRAILMPTWSQLVESYLVSCANAGFAKKSIYNADKCLKAATFSKWKNRFANTITTQEIRTLICDEYGEASESHRKALLKFIRVTFVHGIEEGVLTYNPAPNLKFKIGKKLKTVLTFEQAKTLLNRGKELSWEWYPHVFIALYTGMRNGELFALTWDKIDFNASQIRVDTSWNNKDGYKCTKSGEERLLDAAPELLTFLKELKLLTGNSKFVLPRLGRWDKGEQARELRIFLQAIGIPAIRFHDLRATWATLMLSRGVEPVKVMAMGGWRGMDTMMRYIREAGIDIKGISAVLNLHDPVVKNGKVVKFGVLE